MVQRSRRKPETHLEAERWNTVTPWEKPKADDGPKYMVTGCLREWAVVDGIRMTYRRKSTITEGAFVTLGNDNGMDAYRISSKEMKVNKSGTAKVNSLSSLAILQEMAGFFDFQNGDGFMITYHKCNEREQ
ncbi:hypothetical protein ACX12E_06515 [Paenibacillus vandeheii]